MYPCCGSTNATRDLQPPASGELEKVAWCALSHVEAPSVVRHTVKPCAMQPVAGDPTVRSQPSRSSTNEMFFMGPSGSCGTSRSSHVAPRSSDRNRCWSATRTHTTPLPAAAISANEGSGIGVGDALAGGAVTIAAIVAEDVGDGASEVTPVFVAGVGLGAILLVHETRRTATRTMVLLIDRACSEVQTRSSALEASNAYVTHMS